MNMILITMRNIKYRYLWNTSDSLWDYQYSYCYDYTYDDNSNITEWIISYSLDGGTKYNLNEKVIFEYDTNNNIIREKWYSFLDNVWKLWINNIYKYIYDINNQLISKEVYIPKNDSTGELLNHQKVSYSYNDNGKIIEQIDFSGNDQDWVYVARYLYTYDGNNLICYIPQEYRDNEWRSIRKYEYYYKTITNVEENSSKFTISIYPNPATSQINLSLSEEFISKPEIDIIDYLGNAIKPEFEINGSEITINTSSLSPSVYFLRVISGKKVEVRKFVVV
jgi:hypothetical protein